jgi:hypothetical protein
MKNNQTILSVIISLIIGVLIGYFVRNFQSKEGDISDLKTIFDNKSYNKQLIELFNYKPLRNYEPTPMSIDSSKIIITKLYDNIDKDSSYLKKTISSSYVFNVSKIISMAIMNGANPLKLQMRIYPAVNPGSDSLSFLVAFENDGELMKKDNLQYEWIAPCPRNCQANGLDYFMREEWRILYDKIGRRYDCSQCDVL